MIANDSYDKPETTGKACRFSRDCCGATKPLR
jgi:hypothetical protein